MRRPETVLLHRPWPGAEPDHDDLELASLAKEFAGRWVIWRAVNPRRTLGAWCARRAVEHRSPAGVTASTPGELRGLLEEADRLCARLEAPSAWGQRPRRLG